MKIRIIGVHKRVRLPLLLIWAALQCGGVVYSAWFFSVNKYLPSPYVYDKSDTFMDFFHVLYWSLSEGRYTEWRSVYPPLNFIFMQTLSFLIPYPPYSDAFSLRNAGFYFQVFILVSYLILPYFIVRGRAWRKFSGLEICLFYIIILTAAPMLFALERGNIILLALIPFAMMVSSKENRRERYLPILINLKPYFLIIAFALLPSFHKFVLVGLMTGAVFFLSALVLDEFSWVFFLNLFSFSQNETLFSIRELLSYPSSLAALSIALRHPDTPHLLGSVSINESVALIADIFRGVVAVVTLYFLSSGSRLLSMPKITAATLLICNIGIWTGGYSVVFLIPLIPFFFGTPHGQWLIVLLALCCLPLDTIVLISQEIGATDVFLSGENVQITWDFGLGAMVRPILIFVMQITLLVKLFDIAKKSGKFR